MIKRCRANFQALVLAGVVPVYVGAVGRYGTKVLWMLGLSVAIGLLIDLGASWLRATRVRPLNWLWWVIFPLALPAGLPLWVAPIGLAFAMVFLVHCFGGYGRNLVPVVAGGVIFLAVAWPVLMAQTTKPFATWNHGFSHYASQVPLPGHVLTDLKRFADVPPRDFLVGEIPGAVGESYGAWLLVLGALLLVTRVLDHRFATAAVLGTAGFAWLGRQWFPEQIIAPGYQILAGSFLLYLTVMVPADPFCLPRTPPGRWLGGLIFAAFIVLIRAFGGFAEGVYFAGLLTSVFCPIADEFLGARFYGQRRGAR